MDAELQAKLDKRFSLVERQPRQDVRRWAGHVKSPRRLRAPRATSGKHGKPQECFRSQDAKVTPTSLRLKLSTFTNRSMMLVKEVEKMKATVSKSKTPGSGDQLPQQREEISEEAPEPPALTPVPINSLKWSESPLGTLGDEKLEKALTEQAETITSLQEENAELHQKNRSLSMELSNMRKKFEQLQDKFQQATSYWLQVAVAKGEEEALSAAIIAAQQADVDPVDLEKAEENLKMLHVMQERNAANAARELIQKQKKTESTLVKTGEVGVGEGVSWCDWRDPAGQTVWREANDLRALRMQEFLKRMGAGSKQLEAKVQPVDEHTEDAPDVEQTSSLDLSECLAHADLDSNCSTRCSEGDIVTAEVSVGVVMRSLRALMSIQGEVLLCVRKLPEHLALWGA